MVMKDDEVDSSWSFALFVLLILAAAITVAGDSLDTDREVLLRLKSYLESVNPVNQGRYAEWKGNSSSPCLWPGIMCLPDGTRVTRIDLSSCSISGGLFSNFSALTQLTHLDLSGNTIQGSLSDDLSRCHSLKYLNLSRNILQGKLNLEGLPNLEVLDLSVNRIAGDIRFSFPSICNRMVVANLSENNFTGGIDDIFDGCGRLKYLDLSANRFTGVVWTGFARLTQFTVSQNYLSGNISASVFKGTCTLQELDLTENNFSGEFPGEVSNCQDLQILNLWGNKFTGQIPPEIGSISSLEGLYLGNNSFSRDIPEALLNLTNLRFLDLSKNHFGGEIQKIFGRFTQVKFLVLHGNSYVGGILSSGILKLPNVSRLDLSFNNFTGSLPIEISQMPSLKFLVLAQNQFTGYIPPEYGNMPKLQALDISFNRLNGSIPVSFGNLGSLLWLMLANNSLTGEIPKELGNCSSLLWINLANNQLSGKIAPELRNIGSNATPTFELNRRDFDRLIPGSGECLAMKRWLPADYPPFNFVYSLLTKKSCRNLWDHVLKGNGIFPLCASGSKIRTLQISGYLQLGGNMLSGEVPPEIGEMKMLSMLHLGFNNFSGELPAELGQLPIAVLNITRNRFSGEIPANISNLKCLQNLDLSYNNFSGTFPESLNSLNELSKFNMSYNPLISGGIPSTGQLSTFDRSAFLGNPLLQLPDFFNRSRNSSDNTNVIRKPLNRPKSLTIAIILLSLAVAFLICLVFSILILKLVKRSKDSEVLLEESKDVHDSGGSSSSWLSGKVKVIRLDKTTFTYSDILKATSSFSEERIVGKGGYGIVYRGALPDGRLVAVKKLQREGIEGEREFKAEMKVLTANAIGNWPHPNLVRLYGWCLDGSEKILVYEYMEGGSLEELISDKTNLPWRKRIDIAIDIARALVFLHHECYPSIVHRDVKASNVLLDKNGKARVTDFGLARIVDAENSHVSTVIAGTIGYVAPEYGQTWQATTRGDVYSYGVLIMELATGRRAVDEGEECLVEWARRVMPLCDGHGKDSSPVKLNMNEELKELLRIGVKCTVEDPQVRPNMNEVLSMLLVISAVKSDFCNGLSPPGDRDWTKA